MPPDAPAGVLRYVAVTNEEVRNAWIDLASTYMNQFVQEASRSESMGHFLAATVDALEAKA
ncbi:MAG: hypothetical protein JNK87_07295 [Bryobacterales bacterium]|nr:hypothetical protein [Bryobacterales bacterium]